jgi:uncharacterized membrane protein
VGVLGTRCILGLTEVGVGRVSPLTSVPCFRSAWSPGLEVQLSHDDESASAGGEADGARASGQGLQLPDPGPVAEATEDAGSPAGDSERLRPSDRRGMAERGSSDQGSTEAGYWRQEAFPPVTANLEVVGYSWTSPLPPATELAAYDRIVPGSAERIIAMAELGVRGPIENTAKLTAAEIDASKQGLSFAMALTAAMSIAAVIFFALAVAGIGKTAALTAGGVCLSVPVVMLIRSFITRS